jgi:hypothetical protein
MAFLTLNGVTTKILAANASAVPVEIGKSDRLLGGEAYREVRATKRSWRVRARVLQEADAIPLMRMLIGRGHGFTFDTNADSVGGITPSGTPIYSTHTGTAAVSPSTSSASPVLNYKGSVLGAGAYIPASKFGAGAIAVEKGTTNLLSSNVASGTDTSGNTTGFTAVDGAALTSVTTAAWQGARSLQVVTSGTVNGVRGGVQTSPVSASASTEYVGSVYIRTSTSTTVRCWLRDEVNGIDGPVLTITTTAGTWYRATDLTLGTGGGSPTVSLHVEEGTADSAITINADGWQIETGSYSTSWVNGTRAAGALSYPPGLLGVARDLTINAWVTAPDIFALSPYPTLVLLEGDSGYSGLADPRVHVTFGAAAFNAEFTTRAGDGPGTSDTIASASNSVPLNAWTMITAVLRTNPRAGQAKKELWINGVQAATSSPSAVPDFSAATPQAFYVGNNAGAALWDYGHIDDLLVLPAAASASQIAAWYGAGVSQATLPRLAMGGDLLRTGETINVKASLDDVRMVAAVLGSTFEANLREFDFTIEEV